MLAGSGVALVSAIAAGLAFSLPDVKTENSVATAHKESFEVRVAVVGTLDASTGYEVVSGMRGDRGKVIKIADDGAQVKKGDVIVSFDPTFFESEISRLQGEIKARQALVEYQRQILNLEKSRVEKDFSNAQFEYAKAKEENEQLYAYLDELHGLEKKGYAVVSEIVQAKRKADESLSRLKKSEADIERVSKESVYKIAQAMAEENKTQSDLETSRIALAEVKAEHGKTVLRAPIDGFVVIRESGGSVERRRIRMGDTIWQGQPILYIPDLTTMIVKAQVRENDLNKIRAGLQATVKVDAYPALSLVGQVESIGALAVEDSSAATGKHFQITIKLRESDPRLRPGMTARAFITVDQVSDAITIPIAALFVDAGSTYCYFRNGDGFLRRAIKTGRMNEDVVEITSGLTQGDRVSLIKP
jgi:HlyD family secretion protein